MGRGGENVFQNPSQDKGSLFSGDLNNVQNKSLGMYGNRPPESPKTWYRPYVSPQMRRDETASVCLIQLKRIAIDPVVFSMFSSEQ